MDLKKIVMNLRNKHILKGYYPCVVCIPYNMGHIVENKHGYYVLTITKQNNLHFYALSRFLMKYQESRDFEIKLSEFSNYSFNILSKSLKRITLINGNDFLPFDFFANIYSSYEGEYNISLMCKHFESLNIKEINQFKSEDEMDTKLDDRQKKALIDKYERPYKKKDYKDIKEMYLSQTDRNYKDGDRN